MRLIISPAKKMNSAPDIFEFQGYPEFLEDTDILRRYISGLSYGEAKALWKCNDKIAEENFLRLQGMDLKRNLTPALMAYEGIQYQYMAPAVMDDASLAYVQEHLRILSGFYGILKPLDGVVPYRLEMQAKAAVGGCKNLYEFWGRRLADTLFRETDTIINLASKEYSKCISSYLTEDIRFITCVFGEYKDGKIVEKGTFAKMARGEMVRFLAERQAGTPEIMKEFDRLGYGYAADVSDEKTYVFIKE
ncbi:peroxide stress protein YaaA [Frisingicoccus sp.]|uniref:peroxide stress protein YaaA n=1 Tax=Frisingicoccus sp. TaxID=1918627 RepID=UPI002EC7D88B|nr:peroxide stress protein YaaA [Frisingicoccus sp.]